MKFYTVVIFFLFAVVYYGKCSFSDSAESEMDKDFSEDESAPERFSRAIGGRMPRPLSWPRAPSQPKAPSKPRAWSKYRTRSKHRAPSQSRTTPRPSYSYTTSRSHENYTSEQRHHSTGTRPINHTTRTNYIHTSSRPHFLTTTRPHIHFSQSHYRFSTLRPNSYTEHGHVTNATPNVHVHSGAHDERPHFHVSKGPNFTVSSEEYRFRTTNHYQYTTATPFYRHTCTTCGYNSAYPTTSIYRTTYTSYYENYWHGDKDLNDSLAKTFDRDKERCCGGSVFSRKSNEYRECCGNTEYDKTYQSCCSGVVFDITRDHKCCGSEFYSVKDKLCCFDYENKKRHLVSIPSNITNDDVSYMQCCGLNAYNTQTQICCSDGKDKIFGYNPFYYTCGPNCDFHLNVFDMKYNNTGCCGGKPYDKDKDYCFNPDIAPTPPMMTQSYRTTPSMWYRNRLERCGNETYNIDEKICCNIFNATLIGKLHVKKPSVACCGLEMYYYNYQICCGAAVLEQNSNKSLTCCGNSTYDYTTEVCCASNGGSLPIEKLTGNSTHCCGTGKVPYNESTQICCGNKVFEYPLSENGTLDKRFTYCCGKGEYDYMLYNSSSQRCCGDLVYDIMSNLSCCGNTELYNVSESQCCSGQVQTKSNSCCGDKGFNDVTQLCCENSIVIDKRIFTDQCCGSKNYHPDHEICCRGQSESNTFPKYNNTYCCGGQAADIDAVMCCVIRDDLNFWHEYPVRKLTKNAVCCGTKSLNPENEICCNSTVLPITGNYTSCCGSSTFDHRYQLCCRGVVHEKGNRESPQCCGGKVFEVENQNCCMGAVVDGGKGKMCCYSDM